MRSRQDLVRVVGIPADWVRLNARSTPKQMLEEEAQHLPRGVRAARIGVGAGGTASRLGVGRHRERSNARRRHARPPSAKSLSVGAGIWWVISGGEHGTPRDLIQHYRADFVGGGNFTHLRRNPVLVWTRHFG
jgi:hypothetical protein